MKESSTMVRTPASAWRVLGACALAIALMLFATPVYAATVAKGEPSWTLLYGETGSKTIQTETLLQVAQFPAA